MTPRSPRESHPADRAATPGKRAANAERHRAALLRAVRDVAVERGPAAVRVADVVAAAKLSRNTFYRHFSNVDHCLACARDEFAQRVGDRVAAVAEKGPPHERLARAVAALVRLAADDPAAFDAWLSTNVGADGIDPLATVRAELESMAARELSQPSGPMPPEIVRALVGGLLMTLQRRVRDGRSRGLRTLAPALVGWLLAYPIPAGNLPRLPPPTPARAPGASGDARDRIVAATAALIAEQPTAKATISRIAQRAGVSFSTFYANFDSLEAVALEAIDRRERALTAATAAAFRRERSWPLAVRAALHRAFATLAADPAGSALGAAGAVGGNARVLDRHLRSFEVFEAVVAPGYRLYPSAREIAGEAVGATMTAVLYDHARAGRMHELTGFTATATYIALAPFLPSADAMRVAALRPAAW